MLPKPSWRGSQFIELAVIQFKYFKNICSFFKQELDNGPNSIIMKLYHYFKTKFIETYIFLLNFIFIVFAHSSNLCTFWNLYLTLQTIIYALPFFETRNLINILPVFIKVLNRLLKKIWARKESWLSRFKL